MKTKLLCVLMLLSVSAYAESDVQNQDQWEGASREVTMDALSTQPAMALEMEQLDLSHPWHYGRQDSDALVGRSRHDERHD